MKIKQRIQAALVVVALATLSAAATAVPYTWETKLVENHIVVQQVSEEGEVIDSHSFLLDPDDSDGGSVSPSHGQGKAEGKVAGTGAVGTGTGLFTSGSAGDTGLPPAEEGLKAAAGPVSEPSSSIDAWSASVPSKEEIVEKWKEVGDELKKLWSSFFSGGVAEPVNTATTSATVDNKQEIVNEVPDDIPDVPEQAEEEEDTPAAAVSDVPSVK